MIAGIDMQDFAGHATAHIGHQIDGCIADFLDGHGAAQRRDGRGLIPFVG